MEQAKKSHELWKRLFCTVCVLAVFLIGRNISLYMVNVEQYENQSVDIQNLLVNMVSGDTYQCSIFALGIMPYMTAMILVQFGIAFLPMDIRRRISQSRMEKITLVITFIYSGFLAYNRAMELSYTSASMSMTILRVISAAEMVFFAMALVYLMQINKDHGIGQQTPVILVNVIAGIYSAISDNYQNISFAMLLICMVALVITVMMENVELRIPVQRVSIHNIYADKNYIAFKLNPIGVMPVMFSTSVFMLIKYLLYFIGGIFPENQTLLQINAHMDLTNKSGIWIYLAVIFLLTIGFSFVMLRPHMLADSLQKGGDSIVGVYAGKPTVRYFIVAILALSVLSGLVLSCCMGISLFLGLEDSIPQALALLPSSLMIVVGILSNLIEEIKGYRKFDSYRFFI